MKSILLFFSLILMLSCKAQHEFVNLSSNPEQITSDEWVSWYNKNVKNPIYDTVTVFKVPDFSDIRYIIIIPKGVARVEYNNGRFIGYIDNNRMWIETVTYNKKGTVINGMRPIMITSVDEKGLIVQYERCIGCKFNKNDREY